LSKIKTMGFSTLNEWLSFQQTINPKEIDLSLERVQSVFDKSWK